MHSTQRSNLPRIHIPNRKNVEKLKSSPNISGGTLSPDLSPNTPPVFPDNGPLSPSEGNGATKIDQYILARHEDTVGHVKIYKAFHEKTCEEYMCKVVPVEKYNESLAPYLRVGYQSHINQIEEIIQGITHTYILFKQHYGDLHSYVRNKKRLREWEVCNLFRQIVLAVVQCHENGVILRDLKLRKFVFKNPERTEIKLLGLEDAHLLSDEEDDRMVDKHGCPAYVSPEILNPNKSYSGKAADVWSIGVMLYTMLVGRYPFHDREPSTLFMKIRKGDYSIPECISSRAKCLLRSLLRRDPSERLQADEVIQHPWFKSPRATHSSSSKLDSKVNDQLVPDIGVETPEDFFV